MPRPSLRSSLIFLALTMLATACACRARPVPHASLPVAPHVDDSHLPPPTPLAQEAHDEPSVAAEPVSEGQAAAVFAGGCFWCMESPFEHVAGVISVTSGYIGGRRPNPSYNQVSRGGTGHYEAIRVVYDPRQTSYATLLDVFFHNIDPTQEDGQFCDEGSQYASAIFTSDAEEHRLATEALGRVGEQLHRPIATRIREGSTFYVAEAFHQDFYRNHEMHYSSYRLACGRDARLRTLWGEAASH